MQGVRVQSMVRELPSHMPGGKKPNTWNRNSIVTNSTLCCCLVTKSCPTLLWLHELYPPGFSAHGISQARILAGMGCHFFLQEIFLTQGSNPSLCIAGGFFIPEPPEKPHLKLSFEVNTTYKQKQAWWMLNLWRRKWVVLIGCSRLFSMVLT